MPFVNNVPFFSIFLSMIAGVLMPLFKDGRKAFRVTEGVCVVIGALTFIFFCPPSRRPKPGRTGGSKAKISRDSDSYTKTARLSRFSAVL